MSDLNPCCRCGAVAELKQDEEGDWFATCIKCMRVVWTDDPNETIKGWNEKNPIRDTIMAEAFDDLDAEVLSIVIDTMSRAEALLALDAWVQGKTSGLRSMYLYGNEVVLTEIGEIVKRAGEYQYGSEWLREAAAWANEQLNDGK